MRIATANLVMALVLACASVCGWHATADSVRLETAGDLLYGRADAVDNWRLNPALPERLVMPKERLPLESRIKPGLAVAVAPVVQSKSDTLCAHHTGLPASVSDIAWPHSLLSVLCLLVV